MLRIKIDLLRCEGAGRCHVQAPHTFKIVNGQAKVIEPSGDPQSSLVEAARRCPTKAIAVFDDNGQSLFVPD